MWLYHCKTCGRWQDVTLAKALEQLGNNLQQSLSGKPVPPSLGYPCPAGHGLMVQVQTNDRISVRPVDVESIRQGGIVPTDVNIGWNSDQGPEFLYEGGK